MNIPESTIPGSTNRGTPFVSDIDILNEGLRPFSYWQARALKVLDAWEAREEQAGFRTGLNGLDAFVRLVPGEVTVIGARPGMGKTAMAMQIAANMAPDPASNQRVAVFSAEMSGWMLYLRMACAVSEVTMFDLRSGKASEAEYELTRRAIRAIKDLPLWVDDRDTPSTEYMRLEMERLSEIFEVTGIIFDFFELVGDAGSNQEQRLSKAMQSIKAICKEFNIPAVVLSQLNREVESRKDKMPRLDDLRHSGMIEQLADQVLLLVRPKYYLDNGTEIDLSAYANLEVDGGKGGASNIEDICYAIVAKNRNGRKGIARLGYDGPNMRFFDIQRVDLNQDAGLE